MSIVGLLTILYPFLLPFSAQEERLAAARHRSANTLCASRRDLPAHDPGRDPAQRRSGPGASASKLVALLGVLVATDAALRLIPTVLGASPIFLLIILVGFAYGADFGFLMGALTLLVSAFITGGIGPWLPFQMLTAGWIGLTAGLPRAPAERELAMLALFGGLWGLLFGAIMNIWEWPFSAPGLQQQVGLYWVPGMSLGRTLHTYAHFYLVTSLVYDLFRSIANILLVVLLARPVLRLLDRFRERFTWQPWTPYEPATLTPRSQRLNPQRAASFRLASRFDYAGMRSRAQRKARHAGTRFQPRKRVDDCDSVRAEISRERCHDAHHARSGAGRPVPQRRHLGDTEDLSRWRSWQTARASSISAAASAVRRVRSPANSVCA